MYNELYVAWQKEITDPTLGALSPDFYAKIAIYLNRVAEENKPQEKKTVKTGLLEHEAKNAKRMLEELLRLRYEKLIELITQRQRIPSELLTAEEAKISENFVAFSDAYQKLAKNLLQGQQTRLEQTAKVEVQAAPAIASLSPAAPKRLTLRFVKAIPAIIGTDMKSYGPFKVEDVGSLPADNAKILVKQGLAVQVEVS
jgi:DNA replication initiation complex subunit (GINS family)